uniref:DDE Tnp4 domain-containing protein n=1 Tax=Phlebotomus papatasi TaxID=29031 RepID=A0A1B0DFT1_PHLPP
YSGQSIQTRISFDEVDLQNFYGFNSPSYGREKDYRLFCALRFFAVDETRFFVRLYQNIEFGYLLGCYQRPTGNDFVIALSQSSVSRCVAEVANIINESIASMFIRFPTSLDDKNKIKDKFFRKYGIPGIIGCIDCTHVVIRKPSRNVEYVYCAARKSAHTKNVQIVCNADLVIFNVNPSYGGSTHDSYIFINSQISEALRERYFNGERDSWLLGDSGYAQLPWLMTPIEHPQNFAEERYNVAHKIARATVKRCIRVLKSRFRCLSRQRILMYSPLKTSKIINACCTLHKIMIQQGYELPSEEVILSEQQVENNEVDIEVNMSSNALLEH